MVFSGFSKKTVRAPYAELTFSSRDGIKLKDSYFWAIDKDKDATIGLGFIEERDLSLS